MSRIHLSRAMCALALSGAAVIAHAGVYKYVDENGKTVFTDRPPVTNEQPVQRVNVRAGGAEIKPHNEGTKVYCGSTYLGDTKHVDFVVQNAEMSRRNYEAQLLSARASYDRIVERSGGRDPVAHQRNVEESARRMLELQCAIAWTAAQLRERSDVVATLQAPLDELVEQIDAAQLDYDRRCAHLAHIRVRPAERDKAIAWDNCWNTFLQLERMNRERAKLQERVDRASSSR